MSSDQSHHHENRPFFKEILYTFLNRDIGLPILLLGAAMIAWSVLAYYYRPMDADWFTKDFSLTSPEFWVVNSILNGVGLIILVGLRFPPVASLFFGLWVCIVWGIIAVTPTYVGQYSGILFNTIVITMGILLAQRSSK